MKKIILYLVLPVLLLNFITVLLTPPALAQNPTNIENQQGFEGGSGDVSNAFGQTQAPLDIRVIVANVIVVILGLLGIIFVVLIVFAGFRYMTSMGNEEQADDAKKTIVSATIGLAIILSAFAITSFVTSCLIGAASSDTWGIDICAN
jgi:amino acid transporter